MRYAVFLALSLLVLPSCKGPKGEKGDSGQTGFPNPQNETIYERSGTVGLGSVFLGRTLNTNSAVLVYLESSVTVGQYVLLSVDFTTTGAWAEINYGLGQVQFHNAPATSRYKILVIDL